MIEVAMALGVFSFVIVALVGLMVVVMNSDRNAATDTTLSQMAQSTVTLLRNRGYASVHGVADYADTQPDFYFDVSGKMATDTNGTPLTTIQNDSIYSCVVTTSTSSLDNLDYLVLDFRWPATAPTANQQSRKITTSVAKYD